MSSSHDKNITVRVEYKGITHHFNTTIPKLNGLERLNQLVKRHLDIDKAIKIERKSKRSKGYKKINDASSFKNLLKSLEVKDQLKLKVFDDDEKFDAKATVTTPDSINADNNIDTNALLNEIKMLNVKFDTLSDQLAESIGVHEGVFCDVCNPDDGYGDDDDSNYIKGIRYKCSNCYDYDLCQKCFFKNEFNGTHDVTHQVVAIKPVSNYHQSNGSFSRCGKGTTKSQCQRNVKITNENTGIDRDVFIDIPFTNIDDRSKFIDEVNRLVSSQDVPKDDTLVSSLLDANETYEKNVSELQEKLSKYDDISEFITKNNISQDDVLKILSNHVESKHEAEKDLLLCQIDSNSTSDQRLHFKLINKSSKNLSIKNSYLIFRYYRSLGVEVRLSLAIGPNDLSPNGYKNLYHNMNTFPGLVEDIAYLKSFRVEIVNDSKKKLFIGGSYKGLGEITLEKYDDASIFNSNDISEYDENGSKGIDSVSSKKENLISFKKEDDENGVESSGSLSTDYRTPSSSLINDSVITISNEGAKEYIDVNTADVITDFSSDEEQADEEEGDVDNDDEKTLDENETADSFTDEYEVLSTDDYMSD